MLNTVKEQYLFVQSKNRVAGAGPYDFQINLPDGMLSCDQDEIYSITLQDFNIVFDWYLINEKNNKIGFQNIQKQIETGIYQPPFIITIPSGNYNYRRLAEYVSSQYPKVKCEYLTAQNKFSFTFTETHSIWFDFETQPYAWELWGFKSMILSGGVDLEGRPLPDIPTPDGNFTVGTVIISPNQTNMSSIVDEIVLNLYGVSPYKNSFNIDMLGKTINISNILIAIPFSANPFSLVSYTNLNQTNKMYINEKKIHLLQFQITDFDNTPLKYISDWTATLKIETHKVDEKNEDVVARLDELIKIEKLNLMRNAYGARTLPQAPVLNKV